MASFIFDSMFYAGFTSQFNMTTSTFKVMQVPASFTPLQGTHSLKSQITSEVTGTNWPAGGIVIATSVSLDSINHQTFFTFGPFQQDGVTIASPGTRYNIIYEASGTDSTSSLVACIDWGTSVIKTNEPLALNLTTMILTHPTPK